jgi:hypothetical protein
VVLVIHDPMVAEALHPQRVMLLPDGTKDIWSEDYADAVPQRVAVEPWTASSGGTGVRPIAADVPDPSIVKPGPPIRRCAAPSRLAVRGRSLSPCPVASIGQSAHG